MLLSNSINLIIAVPSKSSTFFSSISSFVKSILSFFVFFLIYWLPSSQRNCLSHTTFDFSNWKIQKIKCRPPEKTPIIVIKTIWFVWTRFVCPCLPLGRVHFPTCVLATAAIVRRHAFNAGTINFTPLNRMLTLSPAKLGSNGCLWPGTDAINSCLTRTPNRFDLFAGQTMP